MEKEFVGINRKTSYTGNAVMNFPTTELCTKIGASLLGKADTTGKYFGVFWTTLP